MRFGISAHARETPDRAALVLDGAVRTYRDLDERTNALAQALRARGVGAGDRVAVQLPNGFAFFEAMVATGKLDATYVPVNVHLGDDEVRFIVDDSDAAIFLDAGTFATLEQEAAAIVDAPALDAAAAAKPMFYTSGTTGRPKGVVHGTLDRERMWMAQEGLAALWGFTAADTYLLTGPAYHAGPGGYAMTSLFVGATVVIMRRFDAREWLRLVDAHGVTTSFMVPAHFIRILEVPDGERAGYVLSSLRLIIHGAAPCPVEVKRRIIAALAPCEVWELYGASEGGATRVGPADWLARPGTVGTPWPGVVVTVRDATGHEVPAGTDGLIYVAPAGGARFRYHNDDEKTAGAWHDGAFTVGDIGHLDADGYLYITDRASDMVIRGGVNVYPREAEEVLHGHPAVVDCAVFGIPDERDGEHLKAMVEVRAPAAEAELIAWCRDRLARFKCPDTVEIVDALPRDDAGKVRKRLLRDAHWSGRARTI